jgi:hypothetical protein
MALAFILLSCHISSPLEKRAEQAALVCYDNGTLVYASDTTVEELGVLSQQWRACREAEDKMAADYRLALVKHCPWTPSGGKREGETNRQHYARVKEESDKQEECMKSKGFHDPSTDAKCSQYGPEPHMGPGRAWVFIDKGVKFEAVNLNCVPRVQLATETTTMEGQ